MAKSIFLLKFATVCDIMKAEGQWEYGRKTRGFVLIVFIFKRFVYSGKKFQTTVKEKEMLLCTRSAFR